MRKLLGPILLKVGPWGSSEEYGQELGSEAGEKLRTPGAAHNRRSHGRAAVRSRPQTPLIACARGTSTLRFRSFAIQTCFVYTSGSADCRPMICMALSHPQSDTESIEVHEVSNDKMNHEYQWVISFGSTLVLIYAGISRLRELYSLAYKWYASPNFEIAWRTTSPNCSYIVLEVLSQQTLGHTFVLMLRLCDIFLQIVWQNQYAFRKCEHNWQSVGAFGFFLARAEANLRRTTLQLTCTKHRPTR